MTHAKLPGELHTWDQLLVEVSGCGVAVVIISPTDLSRGRSELPLLDPVPGQNMADGVNCMVPNYDESS